MSPAIVMDKLRACPFCGKPPVNPAYAAAIYCGNEACPAQPHVHSSTKETAVLLWNRRA